MKPKKLLSVPALMLVLCVAICAQSEQPSQPPTMMSAAQLIIAINTAPSQPPAQDLDELKKQALIVAENKKLKEENAGLQQERDALIGQRDSAVSRAKFWESESTEWQTAATKRKDAITTGLTLDTNQQTDLARAQTEIDRTRNLLDQCRNPTILGSALLGSIFKKDTILGFGAGIVADRLLFNQQNSGQPVINLAKSVPSPFNAFALYQPNPEDRVRQALKMFKVSQ